MTTKVRQLDTLELKERVQRMYTDYRFVSDRADNATQKYGVTSISIAAVKS